MWIINVSIKLTFHTYNVYRVVIAISGHNVNCIIVVTLVMGRVLKLFPSKQLLTDLIFPCYYREVKKEGNFLPFVTTENIEQHKMCS